jgi:hypothetical protein
MRTFKAVNLSGLLKDQDRISRTVEERVGGIVVSILGRLQRKPEAEPHSTPIEVMQQSLRSALDLYPAWFPTHLPWRL